MPRGDAALRQTLAQQQAILEGLQVGVGFFVDRQPVWVNPQWEALFQRSGDEVRRLGTAVYFQAPEDWSAFGGRAYPALARGEVVTEELQLRRADGTLFWCRVRGSAVDRADPLRGVVWIFEDVTDRRLAADAMQRYQAHLEHLAHTDPLTGLPNRQYLHATLDLDAAAAAAGGHALALLFIDLDRFKIVNDTLGHALGDQLLCAVAQRLRGCLDAGGSGGHCIARLGGDEFTVLCRLEGRAAVETVARRLIAALAEPFVVDGYELTVTASIGICRCPHDGAQPAELLMRADTAMYRAKERGRNNFQFYEPGMGRQAERVHLLERELRHALKRHQLELHYQPKVELASGRASSVEALIRWQHPTLGAVSPAEFIPIAEEVGAIVPIGEWALREACSQLARWRALGCDCSVAVNLSSRQFRQPDLAGAIMRTIDEAGVPCELVELEITEGVLMEDTDGTIAALKLLAGRGIRIAVDDFGMGYSSLSYLRRFPVHVLKIDRCFVADIGRPGGDATIARTIIAMAHALNLQVVAEGVETAAQADFLRQHGCETAQGHFFGMPLPARETTALLLRQARR
ncbi:putative bifunctional diguanylate cyclase/phosphodiesterase [Aquabacterium humicola]|uniref:putative bifunctional diguanylate cyclase/phosphodiesterase n=1 Tax=Aquabacterium humicola TaxID=3237377 RepID=UPI0025435004|nr:GGDEF and EAL domain-containing protein [Rubrivivax pictus]